MPKYEILPPKRGAVLPSLPVSSGEVWPWDSPTTTMRKDTSLVQSHTQLLLAQSEQASAMSDLLNKKTELALAYARLGSLQEIATHEYHLGKSDRQHAELMQRTAHEIEEIEQSMRLASVRKSYETLTAPPPPPAPPPEPQAPPLPQPVGLTVDDVEKVAGMMPEMQGTTLSTLLQLLKGALSDKRSP